MEITIATSNGAVNIITSDDTSIQKMEDGSLADIEVGDNITVSGEIQDDDSIQATSILITPNTGVSY